MGHVYKARHREEGHLVALKVLAPLLSASPEFVARFEREARIAASLDYRNVVTVRDSGFDEASGRHFIAFEYVEGTDLEDATAKGPLSERQCVQVARALTKALRHVHEHGLIHRDVKPANVMVSSDGVLKLADLGLAASVEESGTHLTRTAGVVVGTPNYMSPEQATGRADIDARSDLYSLGLTLYRLATGRQPFRGDTPTRQVNARLETECPDPRGRVPELSAAFAELISRLTARDRRDRFQDAKEVILALRGVRAALSMPESSSGTGASDRLYLPHLHAGAPHAPAEPLFGLRSPVTWALVAVVVSVGAVVAAVAYLVE